MSMLHGKLVRQKRLRMNVNYHGYLDQGGPLGRSATDAHLRRLLREQERLYSDVIHAVFMECGVEGYVSVGFQLGSGVGSLGIDPSGFQEYVDDVDPADYIDFAAYHAAQIKRKDEILHVLDRLKTVIDELQPD